MVLLTELGLDLLRRARADETLPMPVIFPLSTWATDRKPLGEWLVESLMLPPNRIGEKQARAWVEADMILPLLDGLDEVSALDDVATRDACVQAMNTFHATHPCVPLVVTSRLEPYRAQSSRLCSRKRS